MFSARFVFVKAKAKYEINKCTDWSAAPSKLIHFAAFVSNKIELYAEGLVVAVVIVIFSS